MSERASQLTGSSNGPLDTDCSSAKCSYCNPSSAGSTLYTKGVMSFYASDNSSSESRSKHTVMRVVTHSEENEEDLRPLKLRGSGDFTSVYAAPYASALTQARTITLCERQTNATQNASTGSVLGSEDDKPSSDSTVERGSIQSKFTTVRHCGKTENSNGSSSEKEIDGDNPPNGIRNIVCLPSSKNRHTEGKPKVKASVEYPHVTTNDIRQPLLINSKTKELRSVEKKLRVFHITPKPFSLSPNLAHRAPSARSVSKVVTSPLSPPHNKGSGSVCRVNERPEITAINKPSLYPEVLTVSTALITDKGVEGEQTYLSTSLPCVNTFTSERERDVENDHSDKDNRGQNVHQQLYVRRFKNKESSTHETTSEAPLSGDLRTELKKQSRNCHCWQRNIKTESCFCSCASETSRCSSSSHSCGADDSHSRSSEENQSLLPAEPVNKMGNVKSRRSPESDTEPTNKTQAGDHVSKEQSVEGNKDREIDKTERKIPALIISDSSMDSEESQPVSESTPSTYTVIRPTDSSHSATANSQAVDVTTTEMHEKMRLRPNTSLDSAYSSDSRSTSIESAVGGHSPVTDAEGGHKFSDSVSASPNPTLQLPTTKITDAKSNSSSSSSSSSPCHPSLWHENLSRNASDSSLRVISDIGSQRKLSSSSGSSFRSSLSFEESEDDMLSSDGESILREHAANMGRRQSKAQSSWTKIRRMVYWSPFMQSFKKKYPWVQLAGHAGNFQPGEEGCILKKHCAREAECLSRLSRDSELCTFAPEYHGIVDKEGEKYTRMQDLLLAFDCPSVMDCKMGIRTYLEDELEKAKIRPRLRHDMYKKMTEISPDEPTKEEHEQKAVTKPRYMQWREHVSSSSNLGFRIEGIKKGDNDPSKDYKLTKTKDQVKNAFKYFIDDNISVLEKYIKRLKDVLAATQRSEFFMTHEVIGSSLLFVHDRTGLASIWMIDFGKTSQLPDNKRLTHRAKWVEGNREDGYLFGLENLIGIFEEILEDLKMNPRRQESTDSEDSPVTPCHAPFPAMWTSSPQLSNDSFDSQPMTPTQENPLISALEDSTGAEGTRKPPLRRQVAAMNSCEDTPTSNGTSLFSGVISNDVTSKKMDEMSSILARNNNKNMVDIRVCDSEPTRSPDT